MPAPEHSRIESRLLAAVCLGLPLLLLAANLLCWWRWGLDLPFVDDWRAYDTGRAGSFVLTDLFQATNNTIAPLGLALDSLAQRLLGGNAIAYQSLTLLLVLGGLLLLQWRLLTWAVPGRRARAVLFLLTVFMLQSGSYWGEQSLAYHQALPLLALLAASWINFASRLSPPWRVGLVVALGVAAGLSYVSGAIGALFVGLAWRSCARLPAMQEAGLDRRAKPGGLALVITGLLCTLLQLGLTRMAGADARGQAMALTWPSRPDFWFFMAGKIGRATGHAASDPTLELAWAGLLVSACLLLALALVWLAVRRASSLPQAALRVALVYLPLLLLVGSYLAMVALGRTAYDAPQDARHAFQLAYLRFHFFWPTLLWPWLAAGVWVLLAGRRNQPAAAGRWPLLVWLPVVAIVALAAWRGVFDLAPSYRQAADFRTQEIRCIRAQMGQGRPIRCPSYDLVDMPDWRQAYVNARGVGASFLRQFPLLPADGMGQIMTQQLQTGPDVLHWQDARFDGESWHGGHDPQMQLLLPDHAVQLRQCRILGLELRLETAAAGEAQFFYQPTGSDAYSEAHSLRQDYQPDAEGRVRLRFLVSHPDGFQPRLRIDPVASGGHWRLLDWRVTCRYTAGEGLVP